MKFERLRRALHEHTGDVIIALFVVAVILAAVRAHQRWPNFAEFSAVKTTVELASVILGTILGIMATIAGYRRYFKGRTFSERATLELSSNPICEMQEPQSSWQETETSGEHQQESEPDGTQPTSILHVVDVSVENIGSMTIWTPNIQVRARYLDSAREFPQFGHQEGIETPAAPLSIPGIEPGEKIYYHYRFLVPTNVGAFRISAELSTSRANIWHRAMTQSNKLAES